MIVLAKGGEKMKTRIHVLDLDRVEKDPDYHGHYEERDLPELNGRHRLLCAMCGWSTYPECREWCHNERIDREKDKSSE